MYKLAIVIPAFKSTFLWETLQSIANQTNKNFTLYIGDDDSPENLFEIVNPYKNLINIKYVHFEKNFGGTDLVAHWERCIDLTDNEEWIWLFSDDDMMDNNCVELFYEALSNNSEHDLYHFNVNDVDEKGVIVSNNYEFPEIISAETYLLLRLKNIIKSYVVEFIFRKAYFLEKGRFVNFDLAWCSDDATWIRLSANKGIRTIMNAKVYWRQSEFNISPDSSADIIKRKFNSEIFFSKWLIDQIGCRIIKIEFKTLLRFLHKWFCNLIKGRINLFPINETIKIIQKFNSNTSKKRTTILDHAYLNIYKKYRILKNWIN
jgi:glycosyltransferase involved in cell wall biosynthesis